MQWVNRPNSDFRGFAGTIVSGVVKPGDSIKVLPSGRESRVLRIVTADGDLKEAVANQSVTLTLADEIDISRGDVLAAADDPVPVADQFEATVVWMSEGTVLLPPTITVPTKARLVPKPPWFAPLVTSIDPPLSVMLGTNTTELVPP